MRRRGWCWAMVVPLLGGCFRVLPPRSHVFAPADDPVAALCFDRCAEWTPPGGDERASCLGRCPGLVTAAGPCRGEPRCIDGEQSIELDRETTLAAVELGARVIVLEAERKKSKRPHPGARK